MSYDGETLKDEALEKYTLGLMEDVVKHYHDRLNDNNVGRLIERGIAKKLVEWIPKKYTEVDIKAMIGKKYTSVITEFMTDAKTMMVVVHEEVNSMGKRKEFNDILMHAPVKSHPGRIYLTEGWKIDKLPEATCSPEDGLKWNDLPTPPPIVRPPVTIKTVKPTIDFSTISQLSPPDNKELPRFGSNVHVGIDLAKVDVKEEHTNLIAKAAAVEIDKQIMKDVMAAAEEINMGRQATWAVPTFGWTDEKTTWDKPNDITFRTGFGSIPAVSAGELGATITDNPPGVWYVPYNSYEEISFREEELDELIDLINTCESRVMKFE